MLFGDSFFAGTGLCTDILAGVSLGVLVEQHPVVMDTTALEGREEGPRQDHDHRAREGIEQVRAPT